MFHGIIPRAAFLCDSLLTIDNVLIAQETQTSKFPKLAALLADGKGGEGVCIGDSITGVYYHTGGRRALSEMLRSCFETCLSQGQE